MQSKLGFEILLKPCRERHRLFRFQRQAFQIHSDSCRQPVEFGHRVAFHALRGADCVEGARCLIFFEVFECVQQISQFAECET